jgi:multidrug efflux system membrane fusion protein
MASSRHRLLGVLAITLTVSGCGGAAAGKAKTAWTMPVQVQAVGERPVAQEIRAGGTLDPAEVVQVTNGVVGIAERVAFNAGDRVEAGQVLVEIEPERYRLARESAAAAALKAQAQVDEAQASLKRREELATKGQGLMTAEELASFRSKLAQAQADLAAATVAVGQAELDARQAVVRAPLAGVVESRTVQSGQYLAIGTVLATQVKRLPLRLRARVTAAEAGALTVGQAARVLPASGGEIEARIVLVGSVGDAATRTVEVIAEIPAPPTTLVAGSFAELVASAGAATPRPAVPQSALRATAQGYVGFIAVAEKGQHVARLRVVEAGMRSPDGWVEVRSGLAVGDALIVVAADGLRDGLAVDPAPAAADAPPSPDQRR